MSYNVNKKDGTLLVTVLDGSVDDSQTTLKLVGRAVPNYGEIMAENLVWLTEHFANSVAPEKPLTGQLWYDTSVGIIKYRTSSQWKSVATTNISNTAPSGPSEADFWWDADDNKLYIWDGSTWVEISIVGDGGSSAINIEEDGILEGSASTLNFTSNLDVSVSGGAATISFSGFTVENNNVSVLTTTRTLNFGTGLSVTDDGSGQVTINATGGGGGGASTLNDLTDVTITSPTTDQVLKYNGSQWENSNANTSSLPAGTIQMFGGSVAPTGWFICDGSTISQSTYAALFGVLGTKYNTGGEPGGTFRLPDARGRVPVGGSVDATSGSPAYTFTARDRGNVGGAETHTLTSAQIPAHNHPVSLTTAVSGDHTHNSSTGVPGVNTPGNFNDPPPYVMITDGGGLATGVPTTSSGAHTHSVSGNTSNNTGGGSSHNNMQPFFVVNYIIFAG